MAPCHVPEGVSIARMGLAQAAATVGEFVGRA